MQISPRSLVAALFFVGITLAACEEAAAPEGQPGDITVTAYVDEDASGSLNAGDIPLANFEVALFRGTQEIATAQTAADGRVTFTDLDPGSYRLEPGGPVPAGATLMSNPSPSAVIDFRGRAVSVEFQYTFFPGVITGRVFRDENSNGTFDEGTDVPGPGLLVFLRENNGGVAGDTLDSVRTDELGVYQFDRVAPGDYFLEFEQLGAINYGASGATREITVVGAATASLNVLYTGSVFVTIAEARATPVDEVVAVIGDITVPAGVFNGTNPGASSEIWVQDSTGGIAVFSVPTADSAIYRLGTRVEVVGEIGLFNGQKQISRTSIRVRSGGAVVAPKSNTVVQARSLADEGELISVADVRVVAIGGGTSNGFNVTTVSATDDTLTVRVNGLATGLTRASFTVNERYNIIGILTQFNGTAQLKPRFASDVQAAAAGIARVVINELMPDPALASDGAGEWIELHNWGTASIDIAGWKLFGNSGGDTARITSSVVIPAGGYVVLGINGDPAANGGVQVDFVYRSGYSLNNSTTTGDVVILRDAAGATVDSVVYVSPPNGASMALKDPSADNTDAKGANWQTSTTPYNASDEGTPGDQNDGYIVPTQPILMGRGTPRTSKHQ